MSKKNLNILKLILHFNIRIPFILWKVKHIKDEEFYSYYLSILYEIFRVLNVNIKMEGIENIDKISSNFFVVSNHRGMVDPLVISKILTSNHPLSYIMKNSLSTYPLIKDVGKRTNSRYLERNIREDLATILELIELQKKGNNYLIFPEGTRNKTDDNTLEFKAASFKIPYKAKSTILPIALYGTEYILDKKKDSKDKYITIYMKIFEPIEYENYKDKKTLTLSEEIRENINSYIEKVKEEIKQEETEEEQNKNQDNQ